MDTKENKTNEILFENGKFGQLNLWNEVNVEEGCPHWQHAQIRLCNHPKPRLPSGLLFSTFIESFKVWVFPLVIRKECSKDSANIAINFTGSQYVKCNIIYLNNTIFRHCMQKLFVQLSVTSYQWLAVFLIRGNGLLIDISQDITVTNYTATVAIVKLVILLISTYGPLSLQKKSRVRWRIQGGVRDAVHPGVQILSFSCSFRQKLQIIPLWELAHPSGKYWIHH